jgi:hypothetical protein
MLNVKMLSNVILSVIMLNAIMLSSVIMIVVMLNIVMPSVVTLSVIRLRVVASAKGLFNKPYHHHNCNKLACSSQLILSYIEPF